MQHLHFGVESLFVGDKAADVLIDSAAHVAQVRAGDGVDLRGNSSDGIQATTAFLLDGGTDLTAETTSLRFEDLDDDEAVASLRGRIDAQSMSDELLAGFPLQGEDGA